MPGYLGHTSEYNLGGINFLNDSVYSSTSGDLVLHLDAANKASYPGSGSTWYDLSGNQSNGTLTNISGYSANNRGYFIFNGSNSGVSLSGANFSLNHMTISSWCFSRSFAQNGFLFEKTTNNTVNTQYSLFFNQSDYRIYFRTYGLSTTDLSVNTYSAGVYNNRWNQITATWDGSNKKIYVNGKLAVSQSNSGTVTQNNTGLAYIGIYGNFAGYPFNGNISSTMVYSRALSEEEVFNNFDTTRVRYGL